MTRASIFQESTEFVRVAITAGPGSPSPEGLPAFMAFVPAADGAPTDGDWNGAEWEGETVRFLIGPTGLALTPGRYRVFVKLTDNPETPVLSAGLITVV